MALMVTSIPFLIGWVVLCAMPRPLEMGLLFFGRVMTGVASGMASIPAAVYIGEMATDRYRGMLVSWPSLGMSVGILLIYLLGWAIQDDWRLVAGITIAPPLLASVLAFLCLKETPFWLLTNGRVVQAEQSFRWIRGVRQDEAMADELREEFGQMLQNAEIRAKKRGEDPQISTITNIMNNKPTFFNGKRQSPLQKAWRHVLSLGSPDAWKPLVIHNLYFFFMQFGGIQVVAAYAVDIMESGGVTMDSYGATVLLGGVQLLGGIGASFAFSR
jgi:MFS family permease